MRKKIVLTFGLSQILIFTARLACAQIDSTVYHEIKNDKRILGIHYAQILFKNGKVKEEGWEYKKENNRTDGKYWGEQYDKFPVIIFRVGNWKEYYKNGNLKVLENIPLEEDSTRNEKHFNRKGELIYEFDFSGKEEKDYKLTEKGRKRKLKNYKKREYRKGKLWLEEGYRNGKKDGVWKEYIKEGQVIVTEYELGKRLRRTKSSSARF